MNLILLQPQLHAFQDERNLIEIQSLIERCKPFITNDDLVLLPEHFTSSKDPEKYFEYVRGLAVDAQVTVVGGSHHREYDGKKVNYGCAVDKEGNVIGAYTKMRPYFDEQKHVEPGNIFGEFQIDGKNILVLICADFWYSDLLFQAQTQPDLILVPALSVSRHADANYSRTLWRTLAITRAYEFGAYIGISDWSELSSLPKYRTCGVGGLGDPTVTDPEKFYQPITSDGLTIFPLDFERLEAFRNDRKMRGFFWKS